MITESKTEQRLLFFYCSFTCIYFPGILILLHLNNSLYNVGSYTFILVLLILMFAEVIKVMFALSQTQPMLIIKTETRYSSKTKRHWTLYIKEVLKFVFAGTILSIIYYIIIVLFGAPVLAQHEETTMLTITLTSLTFVSTSLHLGVDTTLNILMGTNIQKGNIFVDAAKLIIKTTFLGTWLGAIVIPLDWDRPWQIWPIPCIIGALLGYMVAHIIILLKTLPILKQIRK